MGGLPGAVSDVPRPLLAAGLAVALVLRLALAFAHYGSRHDVGVLERLSRVDAREQNVYRAVRSLTYPPPLYWLSRASAAVARATGWPFWAVAKLPAILADLVLVAMLACVAPAHAPVRRAMLALALAPPLWLVSSVHGQVDSISGLLGLGAILVAGARRPWAPATSALLLAGGIMMKKYPMFLIPAWLLALGQAGVGGRARVGLMVLACVPAPLLTLAYAGSEPLEVLQRVFLFTGVYPWFGPYALLELARKLSGDPPVVRAMMHAVTRIGPLVFAGACAGLWLRRRDDADPVMVALALIAAYFALAGNIAPQHVAWLAPLLAAASLRPDGAGMPWLTCAVVLSVHAVVSQLALAQMEWGTDPVRLRVLHGLNCVVSGACWVWWLVFFVRDVLGQVLPRATPPAGTADVPSR